MRAERPTVPLFPSTSGQSVPLLPSTTSENLKTTPGNGQDVCISNGQDVSVLEMETKKWKHNGQDVSISGKLHQISRNFWKFAPYLQKHAECQYPAVATMWDVCHETLHT